MRRYRFTTVDVFTDKRFGGNPLAVFPDARGLSATEMQALAREFNLSETTFVLPPDDPANTARVRIFNPAYEMPFAGHPNVGTGYVLARLGRDNGGMLRFEELAGLVTVRVERRGPGASSDDTSRNHAAGEVTTVTIEAPQSLALGLELAVESVAACAGLSPSDVVTANHAPVEASMGNAFVIAEVSRAALASAVPDTSAFRRVLGDSPHLNGRLSLFLYSREGAEIRARMFAPLAGVFEDPATGSAAAPLGGLLLSLTRAERESYEITQGVEMGRPSLLQVEARRTPAGIWASVGGKCVPVLEGEAVL